MVKVMKMTLEAEMEVKVEVEAMEPVAPTERGRPSSVLACRRGRGNRPQNRPSR